MAKAAEDGGRAGAWSDDDADDGRVQFVATMRSTAAMRDNRLRLNRINGLSAMASFFVAASSASSPPKASRRSTTRISTL